MTGSFYRRTLPHWDIGEGRYFVTMCLNGSTPARGLLRTPATSHGRAFADYDKLLDTNPPVRWLEDRRLAQVVRDALHWGDKIRYDLLGYVVMSSHVHWVFATRAAAGTDANLSRLGITTAFKRHTATACNRLLGRRGRFWQAESYDRVIRTEQELERIVRYVEHNPVRAGLCTRAEDWEFSSAHQRAE
jgi:REP element-mobilizing transposase RayT